MTAQLDLYRSRRGLRTPSRAAWMLAAALASGLARAEEDIDQGVALDDPNTYRVVIARPDWTLYVKNNSLDIWRGNPPYEALKTGHAMFAIAWKEAVALPRTWHAVQARSASISYVFSCSPPVESVLAKVTFYSTSFIPRNDRISEQWHTMQSTVETIDAAQAPSGISWGEAFDDRGRAAWNRAWQQIYKFSCRGG